MRCLEGSQLKKQIFFHKIMIIIIISIDERQDARVCLSVCTRMYFQKRELKTHKFSSEGDGVEWECVEGGGET